MKVVDSNGILEVSLYDAVGAHRGRTPANGGAVVDSLVVEAVLKKHNGSTLDFVENNLALTLLASAGRNATTSTAQQVNRDATGVMLFCNVTVNPGGAETLDLRVQYVDPVAGAKDFCSTGAQALGGAAGHLVLVVRPSVTVGDYNILSGTKVVRQIALPRDWYVQVVHSASGAWTYSLTALYLK